MKLFRNVRLGSPRGASLVEFAIILPVLVMLLSAIVDFARAFDAWMVVTNAAREGARAAAQGADAAEARTVAFTNLQSGFTGRRDVSFNAGDITVAGARGEPRSPVSVTVQARVSIITFPVASVAQATFGMQQFPLTWTATMSME